jgi:hypothetical protein
MRLTPNSAFAYSVLGADNTQESQSLLFLTWHRMDNGYLIDTDKVKETGALNMVSYTICQSKEQFY